MSVKHMKFTLGGQDVTDLVTLVRTEKPGRDPVERVFVAGVDESERVVGHSADHCEACGKPTTTAEYTLAEHYMQFCYTKCEGVSKSVQSCDGAYARVCEACYGAHSVPKLLEMAAARKKEKQNDVG